MNDATTKSTHNERWRQKLLNAAIVSTRAAIRCALCPRITADTHSVDNLDKAVIQSPMAWTAESEALVADEGWRTSVLAWISDYHDRHGHGPTWGEFRDTHDPDAATLPYVHRHRVLASLYRHGYVTGKHIPFGLDVRDEQDRQQWLANRAKNNARKAAKKAAQRGRRPDQPVEPAGDAGQRTASEESACSHESCTAGR